MTDDIDNTLGHLKYLEAPELGVTYNSEEVIMSFLKVIDARLQAVEKTIDIIAVRQAWLMENKGGRE